MKDLYLIKIGGGSITDKDKPMVAKRDVIARLLKEIYEAKQKKGFDVIIGNGAGSFGHVIAKQYRTNEGFVNGESLKGASLTKHAANALNNIVLEVGANLSIPLFPFAASSFSIADNKKLIDGNVESIKLALEKGFIPLVYGDVVIDKKQGVSIASTEEVLRFISGKLHATKAIVGCDVDGVFDKDPFSNPDAKLIKEVNSKNLESTIAGAGGARKVDVTGGMKTKIMLLYEIIKANHETGYLVNVTKPGYLNKLLLGQDVPCTMVKV